MIIFCIFITMASLVQAQSYQSPCPGTFEYKMKQNGELYGLIKVYSFKKYTDITVKFSINRKLQNYMGRLQLVNSGYKVIYNTLVSQLLTYELFFPMWRYTRPKITEITVNGRVVCFGPPLEFSAYVHSITQVTLRHSSVTPLSRNYITDNNNVEDNSNNGNRYFAATKLPDIHDSSFQTQKYENPCPKIFQYKKNQHEGLFGSIKVYAFEKYTNIRVIFSVGNKIQGFKGRLEAVSTKNYISKTVSRQPFIYSLIIYKLTFPEWHYTPPKIAKIIVNDRLICSGPPMTFDESVNFITTVTLMNCSVTPLSQKHFTFNDNLEVGGQNSIYPTASTTMYGNTGNNNNLLRPSVECGVTETLVQPLMVNGNLVVSLGLFPWLTAIFVFISKKLEYQCGGSLVSNRHVITAAHCLIRHNKKLQKNQLYLLLGKLSIANVGNSERMIGIASIHFHPDFKISVNSVSHADIAVLVLSEPIEFSYNIKPLCLWAETDDLNIVVGKEGTVVGWGYDENGNEMTMTPKQTNLPIVSQEQCLRSNMAYSGITSYRTFCAGRRNNSGPCTGDSGSGFVMKRGNRWFLRGVVSYSLRSFEYRCDLSNYVVFTDVSKFRSWLRSVTV